MPKVYNKKIFNQCGGKSDWIIAKKKRIKEETNRFYYIKIENYIMIRVYQNVNGKLAIFFNRDDIVSVSIHIDTSHIQ